MNDTELITLTAAILLTRRTPLDDPEMLKDQLNAAVETARRLHSTVKAVVAGDAAQAAQIAARSNIRRG